MKRELFLIVLLILGTFVFLEWQRLVAFTTESFVSDPTVNVPLTKPAPSQIGVGDPQPFTPISTALLAPPPGQTASVNAYPAKDPAQQKVKLKRIKEVYQALTGFIQNEADGLSELSDPAVKLPLESIKADLRRVDDERQVLAKNPGIESTLTEDDVNQMEANLRYLQKKWRLSVNSMSGVSVEGFQGPSDSTGSTGSTGPTGSTGTTGPTGTTGSSGSAALKTVISGVTLKNLDFSLISGDEVEYEKFTTSFLNDVSRAIYIPVSRLKIEEINPGSVVVTFSILGGSASDPSVASFVSAFMSAVNSPGSLLYGGAVTSNIDASKTPKVESAAESPSAAGPSNQTVVSGATGGQPGVNNATGSSGPTGPTGSKAVNASLYQLRDLVLRISAEIIRLQASGTTDPIVSQRVNVLTSIKTQVSDIIRAVESGQIKEAAIPILQSDYYAFLPVMTNISMPLPKLISKSGASSILNSLFPLYAAGDISGAALAMSLFEKYAGGLVSNLSWSLNLSNKSDAELAITQELARALSGGDVTNTADSVGPYAGAADTSYRGMFDSVIKKNMGTTNATGGTGPAHSSGSVVSAKNVGGPSKLDWKQRAQQICDMIDRRGLKSADFGCMQNTDAVSDSFSFRGYAKMVCARLSTNYDPGIPELCGCPPPTWAGWRG